MIGWPGNGTHHTQALCTDYNQSLAATIELSLASPTFHRLGPNAHDLLGIIAFYPWASMKTTLTGYSLLSLT